MARVHLVQRRPAPTTGRTLPPGLVAVHPAVCSGEQRLVRIAVVREDSRADADCERQRLTRPRLELNLVDGTLQLEALPLRFLATASRQHDDELVASVADADVVGPDRRAQHAGDLAQRAVAD